MNPQEIFDTVSAHLRSMPRRSIDDGICKYRAEGGLKCAVGCLITDDEYDEEMDEGVTSVSSLADRNLLPDRLAPYLDVLERLQSVHDYGFNWGPADGEDATIGFNERGESALERAAGYLGLVYTPRSTQ